MQKRSKYPQHTYHFNNISISKSDFRLTKKEGLLRLLYTNTFVDSFKWRHNLLPRELKAETKFKRRSIGVNVICNGSPSRIRIVRRISFGITIRPRSSILLTIPVAFIYIKLLFAIFFIHISYYLQIKVFYVILYLVLIGSFKHTASIRFSTSAKFISALSSHRHTSQCIFLFSLSTISHDFFIFPTFRKQAIFLN